jgi:hypothetical protein
MMDISDRKNDTFHNCAKSACREANLRVLREAAYLLWEDSDRTRLRCDWCELMGATGWLTLELLEGEQVLAPHGFVGIDLDSSRIDGFRQRRPNFKWIAGNLYEHLDAAELANVGILNLDEYGAVGNLNATVDLHLIQGVANRSLDKFGEFALFWNHDLDAVLRHGKQRGQALRLHAELLCKVLQPALPRRELTSEMLLPIDCEQAIDDGFIGTIGAFQIYRGSVRGHRMANLRLIVR